MVRTAGSQAVLSSKTVMESETEIEYSREGKYALAKAQSRRATRQLTRAEACENDAVREVALEHPRNEAGADVLLAISREFGRSLEWLLTSEE